MIEISPQRRALLGHLLPEDALERCERAYLARVRLLVCTRVRATFEIRGRLLVFQLSDRLGGVCLTVKASCADEFRSSDPNLWDFVFHRAAEAILAVRNGHKEHVLPLQGRKTRKQGADV